MDLAIAILVDGLVYASWLFLVAVGLSLIFGVMKILNVTHGAFYAFGAYCTAWAIGHYFQIIGDPIEPLPESYGAFVIMGLSAILVGVVLGTVIEKLLIRRMYGHDEVVIVLATFATFLILEDTVLLVWGTDPYFAYQPYGLFGMSQLGSTLIFNNYDLSLIVLALIVAVALWWGLNKTNVGKMLLAVIFDREISAAMGINVDRVFLITFVIGAMLGALGGAYTAPMISVVPGIGVEVIVLAFAVVVIGGMGSVGGAIIGSLIVGIARAWAVHQFPEVELFVIYAVMAIVLIFRPEGLFSPPKARKI